MTNLLLIGYTDFADMLIYQYYIYDVKQAVEEMIKINPDLKYDKVFNNIFPTVYQIQLCKYKISQQKNTLDVEEIISDLEYEEIQEPSNKVRKIYNVL